MRTALLTGLFSMFAALAALASAPAHAGALDGVTDGEAGGALRDALTRGADAAVARLGQTGGFMNNPEVRIPLPSGLRQAKGALRMMGRGKEVESLEKAMNQAAERAVPQSKTMLVEAVKSMSVADAKQILTGGDDSVTKFFRAKTEDGLTQSFLPVVSKQVADLGLAKSYDRLAGQGAKLGLVKGEAVSMDRYVTASALNGLYLMIAKEERALRANPLQAGSKLIGKVFGLLR